MRNLLLTIFITIILLTCTRREEHDISPFPLKLLTGTCINDQTPLLEKPGKANKIITTLYLGDEVQFLGDSASIDYSVFYKVEIAEGTEAWVDKNYIVMNASPAAVLTETYVYAQADNSSEPIAVLHPAEFVVTIKYNSEWNKVVGANNKINGWVQNNTLSFHTDDVYIATLAFNDLLDEEGSIRKKELPYFLKSLPNQNASLAIYLQDIQEAEVTNKIEESIQDYELNYYTELVTPKE